jgi:hypothetical protein
MFNKLLNYTLVSILVIINIIIGICFIGIFSIVNISVFCMNTIKVILLC